MKQINTYTILSNLQRSFWDSILNGKIAISEADKENNIKNCFRI